MDKAFHATRWIFGLWFFGAGVEYFLPWDLQPLGEVPAARAFTLALIDSGIFAVVKILEAVIGLCILANRWVLPAALAALPLTFVISWWNVVLEGSTVPILFGIVTPVFNAVLLWPFRHLLCPLMVAKPEPRFGSGERFAGTERVL